jgi:hypothetical protein
VRRTRSAEPVEHTALRGHTGSGGAPVTDREAVVPQDGPMTQSGIVDLSKYTFSLHLHLCWFLQSPLQAHQTRIGSTGTC